MVRALEGFHTMQLLPTTVVDPSSLAPRVVAWDLLSTAARALRRAGITSQIGIAPARGDVDQLVASLGSSPPRAIVFDMASPSAPMMCSAIRQDPRGAHVPLFGVTESVTDRAFTELFAWGGDDLVSIERVEDLAPRIRVLRPTAETDTPPPRGRALVADACPERRAPIARVLHRAGYEVLYASTVKEIEHACETRIALVSIEHSLAMAGGMEALGVLPNRPLVVIAAHAADMGLARTTFAARARVAVHDLLSPPDNVLFLANELAAISPQNQRSSRRVLHGTRVWMRVAGGEQEVVGSTFNLSESGMFVRTLHPFAIGQEAWLELTPPSTHRRVRLGATVVWRRPFSHSAVEISPPGVGFWISGGMPDDVARYTAGYERLAQSLDSPA
jgi:CheY-like chemotaxis protein/Tfp pilus assembly protein PilZ